MKWEYMWVTSLELLIGVQVLKISDISAHLSSVEATMFVNVSLMSEGDLLSSVAKSVVAMSEKPYSGAEGASLKYKNGAEADKAP